MSKHTVVDTHAQAGLIHAGSWPISHSEERSGLGAVRAAAADFLCTFSAPKRVLIGRRQGKLAACAGLLYWLLVLGIIVAYVFVYGIMYTNDHLGYETPMGSVRIGLRRPTQVDPETDHVCNPAHHSCENAFASVLDLPYCERSSMTYKHPDLKRKCRLWDEDSVVARNVGADVQIGTYLSVWEQQKICDGTGKNETSCRKTFHTKEKDKFYLADVENFVVTIQHSMRTPLLLPEVSMRPRGSGLRYCELGKKADETGKAATNLTRFQRLQAYMDEQTRAKNCTVIMPNPALSDDPLDIPDAFLLGDLLKAAHVDLDQNSPAQHASTTRRAAGTTIVLTIHYENTRPWRDWYRAMYQRLPIRYHYTVRELPVDINKMRNVHWDEENSWNGKSRKVVEIHGIRLTVLFTGKIGSWSWANLMVILAVSATALTASESLVTKIIKFAPSSCEHGGVKPAHLAEHFQDNALDISEDWAGVLKENLETHGLPATGSESRRLLAAPSA
eukprot:TRINITY_DN6973_c0_g2_i1.p1 TRINITY_DN6973_c0_g2~~TRINITY_DN6973_c0_g2_i1.p1  ORF type:complete len:502 (-),score=67.00 TRINITY_DN6973_c0_g2_i1:258-1763(-)